jgi:hypothetical protein
MAFRVDLKTGTREQNLAYTGKPGELTVDVTNNTLRVHDGVTAGGTEAARGDLSNVPDAHFYQKALASGVLSQATTQLFATGLNGGGAFSDFSNATVIKLGGAF